MNSKRNILIELRAPYLTAGEADELRAFIVTLRPKIHLVMADWPWIEVRGIGEQAAQQIVERVRAVNLRCVVVHPKPTKTLAVDGASFWGRR